jgi:hypothetical protein
MDISEFEKEWTALGVEICHAIYKDPRVLELSKSLKKNGFLTLEEKSDFINISDKTKYDIIYAKYGAENSEGYRKFSEAWKKWFQEKGVSSAKDRGQRNSVDHILFGSTPDPVEFLTSFEDEVLNNHN